MTRTLPPRAPEDEAEPPEPPRVRALRRLVTLLTLTLIVGMATVAGVIVWRLTTLAGPAPRPPALAAPLAMPALALPAGAEATALGASAAELFVLIRGPGGAEQLLTYDRATGALLSTTPVARTAP